MLNTLRRLVRTLREPVLPETRANLTRSWARLPPALQTPHQMLGRHGNGCGATIGAMPRCDFACRGCYLGEGANTVAPQAVEEIKRQMRLLRPTLGHAGNLQLTDGEVTLRPESELIDLLRYARSLDLIPMLMTHGDSFRRRPGLLERLMIEGGLREVSIHVDTTQRGRRGDAYKYARREADLNPLRDQFAAMIRTARATTGRPLRAATTVTVTPENVGGVADVVRWLLRNVDAFHLVSFQPVAQVGRTEAALGSFVDIEALWGQIADGLDHPDGVDRMARGRQWLGHPACNRHVHGLVASRSGMPPSFHPILDAGDPTVARVTGEFLDRFGGITVRLDGTAARLAKALGVALAAPGLVLQSALPFAWRWLGRLGQGRPLRAAVDLAARRLRIHDLLIVSHHFMSPAELDSPLGRERLGLCVFHVPIGDRLVPMCEVNATDLRDRYYAGIGSAGAADSDVAASRALVAAEDARD